jgi:uncharacterized membrane protein YcaP (DUF421 family)
MWENVLFGGASDSLLRILLSAPLLYGAVVALFRVSGKRSSSQMNSFDWIVTVAIGSLVGSGILLRDVGVIETVLAISLLLGLQYLLTWTLIRNERISNIVKAAPRLLVYQGKLIPSALRDERISEREVLAAVRDRGFSALEDAVAVVLETDATFSVLGATGAANPPQALDEVAGFPPQA